MRARRIARNDVEASSQPHNGGGKVGVRHFERPRRLRCTCPRCLRNRIARLQACKHTPLTAARKHRRSSLQSALLAAWAQLLASPVHIESTHCRVGLAPGCTSSTRAVRV